MGCMRIRRTEEHEESYMTGEEEVVDPMCVWLISGGSQKMDTILTAGGNFEHVAPDFESMVVGESTGLESKPLLARLLWHEAEKPKLSPIELKPGAV